MTAKLPSNRVVSRIVKAMALGMPDGFTESDVDAVLTELLMTQLQDAGFHMAINGKFGIKWDRSSRQVSFVVIDKGAKR